MSKKYELMLILTPDLNEKEVESAIVALKTKIEDQQGQITLEDSWGLRRFAYPINKQEKGYYYLLEFDYDPQKLKEFEEEILLDPQIVRHLITIPPAPEKNTKPKIAGKSDKGSDSKEVLDEKLEKILGDDLGI
jgi:small subunit ribosomal protein S6